jgi:HAD superfamily hydrolase (TIGR01509 family)
MLIFQKRPFDAIKAIIFDLDGTLIDSIDVYRAIIIDIMDWLGMEMSLSRELLFEGFSQGKKLSDILLPPDLEDRVRTVEQFNVLAIRAFRETFLQGKVKLINGVNRLFRELKGRGFSLAIVTSSSTEVVVPFLKAKKLHSHLKCVLGRTEVPRLKPFPDPLLKCMEILNVEPCESIYVGDSVIDIQAGKAAEMVTVGVLTGTTDLNRLEAEAPDAIMDSVGDLPTVL